MLRAYKGYFEQGRFVSNEAAVIPDNVMVQIMVSEDVSPIELASRSQLEVVEGFFADLAALKDEDKVLTDDDWLEFENLRSQTNLVRAVNI